MHLYAPTVFSFRRFSQVSPLSAARPRSVSRRQPKAHALGITRLIVVPQEHFVVSLSFDACAAAQFGAILRRNSQSRAISPTHRYDFFPPTYVLPADTEALHAAMARDRGAWIVKPIASSCGRGISIVQTPQQLPHDDIVVSKYIGRPLLVDGAGRRGERREAAARRRGFRVQPGRVDVVLTARKQQGQEQGQRAG